MLSMNTMAMTINLRMNRGHNEVLL